jgi:hypothetical protein
MGRKKWRSPESESQREREREEEEEEEEEEAWGKRRKTGGWCGERGGRGGNGREVG